MRTIYNLFLIGLMMTAGYLSCANNNQFSFIDLEAHDPARYTTFLDCCRRHGYSFDYYNFADIKSGRLSGTSVHDYPITLFNISRAFIAAEKSTSLHRECTNALSQLRTQTGQTIILALPSERQPKDGTHPHRVWLSKQLGLLAKQFQNHIDAFLAAAPELRGREYDTTLLPASTIRKHKLPPVNQHVSWVPHVPINALRNLWPHSLYLYDEKHDNHIILTYNVLLRAADMEGSFHLYPFEQSYRESFKQVIDDLAYCCTHFGLAQQKVSSFSFHSITRARSSSKQLCAWTDPEAFSKDTPHCLQQQQQLISYLFDAQITTVWLRINPQLFHGVIANGNTNEEEFTQRKEKRKERHSRYLKAFSRFTALLKHEAEKRAVDVPQVICGIELLHGYYNTHTPACDIYGTEYNDIPSPLDRQFWQEHILNSLALFMQYDWPEVSNGIAISGVLFDLELYLRKKTGTFEAEFLPLHLTIAQAQKEAYELGCLLRSTCKKIIPEAKMACYAPSISTNWFFAGLYKGLSSVTNPLDMYTFLTDTNRYTEWFTHNDIQLRHHGALLLSKVTSPDQGTALVQTINTHNDGCWLNRFTRLIPSGQEDWAVLETTDMSTENIKKWCRQLGTLKTK